MFLRKVLLGTIMVCCTVSAKEIVLQNGTNGYSGCKDSWILRGATPTLIMDDYMPERFDVYADTCLS